MKKDQGFRQRVENIFHQFHLNLFTILQLCCKVKLFIKSTNFNLIELLRNIYQISIQFDRLNRPKFSLIQDIKINYSKIFFPGIEMQIFCS